MKLVNCYWNHHSRELTLVKDDDCVDTLPAVHVEYTKQAVQEFNDKTYNIVCTDAFHTNAEGSLENPLFTLVRFLNI